MLILRDITKDYLITYICKIIMNANRLNILASQSLAKSTSVEAVKIDMVYYEIMEYCENIAKLGRFSYEWEDTLNHKVNTERLIEKFKNNGFKVEKTGCKIVNDIYRISW